MQNDLVEAVARGLCSVSYADRAVNEYWHEFVDEARAVIPIMAEHLREPTPAMIESGVSALSANGVDDPNEVDAAMCWRAMLDAAAISAAGEMK